MGVNRRRVGDQPVERDERCDRRKDRQQRIENRTRRDGKKPIVVNACIDPPKDVLPAARRNMPRSNRPSTSSLLVGPTELRRNRLIVLELQRIERKEASLRILAMNLDTATPTGRLMVNLIGSVAQFEREIMLERRTRGRAAGEGKYKGPRSNGASEGIRDRAAGQRGHETRGNRPTAGCGCRVHISRAGGGTNCGGARREKGGAKAALAPPTWKLSRAK